MGSAYPLGQFLLFIFSRANCSNNSESQYPVLNLADVPSHIRITLGKRRIEQETLFRALLILPFSLLVPHGLIHF